MVNLYTLPTSVIVLFIVVILSLFLANSVLYYFLMPQAQFRQLGRKCLEGSSLVLLMAMASILYEVYTDSLSGIVYDEATDFWRYSTALAGTAGALYWIHDRQAGSLPVLAASLLLLPDLDGWLPGSLVLALAWRLVRLLPQTYEQYQKQLTARSCAMPMSFGISCPFAAAHRSRQYPAFFGTRRTSLSKNPARRHPPGYLYGREEQRHCPDVAPEKEIPRPENHHHDRVPEYEFHRNGPRRRGGQFHL